VSLYVETLGSVTEDCRLWHQGAALWDSCIARIGGVKFRSQKKIQKLRNCPPVCRVKFNVKGGQ
jgi:predicted membrane protein